jgi:uncharacterized protein YebE (UPF0316 family)
VKEGGVAFGNYPDMSAKVVEACRRVTSKPLITKLSPNQTDIQENARRCIEAGTDGFAVINTVMGMAIDAERRRPVIGNVQGGLSGPAIKPIALLKVHQVYQVAKRHNVPIIGQGGIVSARDALEFIIAGATAVGVGTALFYDPLACRKINDGIRDYLLRHQLPSVRSLVGSLVLPGDVRRQPRAVALELGALIRRHAHPHDPLNPTPRSGPMTSIAELHPVILSLWSSFSPAWPTCRSAPCAPSWCFGAAGCWPPMIGFFEIVIWVIAAGQVLQNLDAWYLIVAYAGGFGAGNYVGIWLESKLAIGREMVSAISFRPDGGLARQLRERGFRAIDVDADMGRGQPVDLVITVTRRRRVPELLATILEADPEAQYSISDIKMAHEGFDPAMLGPRPESAADGAR